MGAKVPPSRPAHRPRLPPTNLALAGSSRSCPRPRSLSRPSFLYQHSTYVPLVPPSHILLVPSLLPSWLLSMYVQTNHTLHERDTRPWTARERERKHWSPNNHFTTINPIPPPGRPHQSSSPGTLHDQYPWTDLIKAGQCSEEKEAEAPRKTHHHTTVSRIVVFLPLNQPQAPTQQQKDHFISSHRIGNAARIPPSTLIPHSTHIHQSHLHIHLAYLHLHTVVPCSPL